jgi:hypothetical protein
MNAIQQLSHDLLLQRGGNAIKPYGQNEPLPTKPEQREGEQDARRHAEDRELMNRLTGFAR